MTQGAAPLVFITGASSGIGQALAERFFAAGYRLALAARRSDAIDRWRDERGFDAARIVAYRLDVCDFDAVAAAGLACLQTQGVPDVVVANAGISIGVDTSIAADLDVMKRTFETNVLGMAATFQPFIDAMRVRGSGRLVGIASVTGIRGIPGHGAYGASKAAVISYCESLRGELRGTGVRVVTIVPGYVDTPLTRANRYAMPFLMSSRAFAERAYVAIEKGTTYRVIPQSMQIVAWLLRALPNALYDRAFAGRPRKRRQGQ